MATTASGLPQAGGVAQDCIDLGLARRDDLGSED